MTGARLAALMHINTTSSEAGAFSQVKTQESRALPGNVRKMKGFDKLPALEQVKKLNERSAVDV